MPLVLVVVLGLRPDDLEEDHGEVGEEQDRRDRPAHNVRAGTRRQVLRERGVPRGEAVGVLLILDLLVDEDVALGVQVRLYCGSSSFGVGEHLAGGVEVVLGLHVVRAELQAFPAAPGDTRPPRPALLLRGSVVQTRDLGRETADLAFGGGDVVLRRDEPALVARRLDPAGSRSRRPSGR